MEENEGNAKEKIRQALVINIESWATPIVGVVMLALGLLAGYGLRPLITPTQTPVPQAAAPQTSANPPAESVQVADPIDEKAVASMLANTRHFRGNANAPVTILEFSDFQ